jgi:threonine/homoserine/homoserine lactone efflux protein
VLGALLVLLALKDWRGRPRDGDEAPTPKWMGAIDGFNTVKALAAGVVLAAANPKNLLLAIAAAASIAQTAIPGGQQAVAYAVFALIGAIGVAVPVVVYFALGDRARPILERMKAWMAQHNAVIMTVLFLVLGGKLIGDAITGLSG